MDRTHCPPKLLLKKPIEAYDCPASREVRRLMSQDARYSADVMDDTVRLLASLRDRFGSEYQAKYMPFVEVDDDFRDSITLGWSPPGRRAVDMHILPDRVSGAIVDADRPADSRLQKWETDLLGLRDAASVTSLGSFLAGTA